MFQTMMLNVCCWLMRFYIYEMCIFRFYHVAFCIDTVYDGEAVVVLCRKFLMSKFGVDSAGHKENTVCLL